MYPATCIPPLSSCQHPDTRQHKVTNEVIERLVSINKGALLLLLVRFR